MSLRFQLIIVGVLLSYGIAFGGDMREFQMSVDDVFRVVGEEQWQIDVEKELTLRFADVKITSKNGYPFNMMLYFKCDTPDLHLFDTAEKVAHAVRSSSEPYLPYILEKQIQLQPITVKSRFGFLTVLTDAEVAQKDAPLPDEFKYLTRGMVRLSKDSVLGFSIMTNDTESPEYKKLLDYVYDFVKIP